MDHLLQYRVGNDGIAVITIDQKNNPANLFSMEFIEAYQKTAQKAIDDAAVKGVVVTSGQRLFMAGADLRELSQLEGGSHLFENIMRIHRGYRALEQAGKPFVAAINGTALGGGMELCLTCHFRIARNDPSIRLGFPEVKVGLLPGGGGTAKTPYLLGIRNSLTWLLQGLEVRPGQALEDGLIDALADTNEDLLTAAKQWILQNPEPLQPWDNPGHRIPGGGLMTPGGAATIMAAIGNVQKQTYGNYPAAEYILSTVHDGLQISIDRALEVEARYFIKALSSTEAKNMIRTGFLAIQAAKKGKSRPGGVEKYPVNKLGILGAGMMGAGIAYVSAKSGMEVVLKDVSIEAAERGKLYSSKLLDKAIGKGYSTLANAEALLARIRTTDDPAAVEGCDLVIEAVFENPELKARVTRETETVLDPAAVFASNTSTIPITQLAQASERPHNFIGIHFFSPVDRMPLVEIIVGQKTAERSIAAAIDYVLQIGKVPIVVNDRRGFYTSRTFSTYCSEGAFLLEEGVPAAMIENIAKSRGMPVGPLAVTDEVSLTLSIHIYESDPSPDKSADATRSYRILKKLVSEYQREGKKAGRGYYDYPRGGKKRLWPELARLFGSDPAALDRETIGKRLLHRQAIEAWRCLEDGVLRSTTDADVGSVLGWGFPVYTGGVLSYIDYVGMPRFVDECDDFAERFGDRFGVPAGLRKLAMAGKSIHDAGSGEAG